MTKADIVSTVKKHIKNGFLHVFSAGTINKIVSLCSSIFIVRVLNQNDYGMYSYVINIVNIFMLFNGLGTLTGLLQYGSMSEDINKRNGFFHYGMRIGFLTNIVVSLLIIGYAICVPQKINNAIPLLIIASLIPMFRYANDSIPTYLRTENENKKYGNLYTLNSVLLFALMLLMAFFYGVSGALVSRYIANAITVFLGIIIAPNFRKCFASSNKNNINLKEKKDFLRYSIITCFNNAVSQLLYNIDIFVIGIVVGTTTSIASYKVATTIPFGLSFISISIITYFYPIIVRHRDDTLWITKNYKRLLIVLGSVNGAIAIFCYVLAPFIIRIIFGNQYSDAVTCFRILIVGYWISSTFRISSGNVLDMLLKVKVNFIISVIAGISNILLDIFLVKMWGSIGAAIATCSIFLLTSVMSNLYIIYYLKKGSRNYNTL